MNAIQLYVDKTMIKKSNKPMNHEWFSRVLPYLHPKLMKEILTSSQRLFNLDYYVIEITDPLKEVFLEVQEEMKEFIYPNAGRNLISSVAAFIRLSTMSYDELTQSPYFKEITKERGPNDDYIINFIVVRALPVDTAIQLYSLYPTIIGIQDFMKTRKNELDNHHMEKLQTITHFNRSITDMLSFLNLSYVEETINVFNWKFVINDLRVNPTFTYEFGLRYLEKIIIDTSNSIEYAYDERQFNNVFVLQYIAPYEFLKEHIEELDYRSLSYLFMVYTPLKKEYYDGLFRIVCEYPQKPWYMGIITKSVYVTIDMILGNPQVYWEYSGLVDNVNITEDIIQRHPEIHWSFNSFISNPNIGWEIAKFSDYNTYTNYRKSKTIKITSEYILKMFNLIKV